MTSLDSRAPVRRAAAPSPSFIESLEPRIAPAAVLSFTDVDGDLVTVKSSKGTLAQLDAAVARDGSNFITAITLDPMNFDGASISVDAKRPANGIGDGLVNVARLFANGVSLGTLTIDGDLGGGVLGNAVSTNPAVKTLSVKSIGRENATQVQLTLLNSVGTLTVAGDIAPTGSVFIDGNITSATIKGSLVGIGGDAQGGSLQVTGDIKSAVVKGYLLGGENLRTGQLIAVGNISKVTVGEILGSSGVQSASIVAFGTLGKVTVLGNIFPGSGTHAGSILARGDIQALTVNGAIGAFGLTVAIHAGIDPLDGTFSFLGKIGSITTKGSIHAFVAATGDIQKINVGRNFSASVSAGGNFGSLTVKGEVFSGALSAHGFGAGPTIKSVTVAGNVLGLNINAGEVVFPGQSANLHPTFGSLRVGGNVEGLVLSTPGSAISSQVANVTILGDSYGLGVYARHIISASIGGSKVPLTPGAGTDNDLSFGVGGFDEVP